MVPAGTSMQRSPTLPLLDRGDILIDGGNSYYIDDIPRSKELQRRDPLRRRRHQRRRLGPGTRLLHDDRRRPDVVEQLDPMFVTLAPGPGDVPRTPGRESLVAPPSRAICTAVPTAPAIS